MNQTLDQKNNPTAIVIFGATGNLSFQKIYPALYDLHKNGFLPETFRVIGISRKEFNDDLFRNYVKDSIKKKNEISDQPFLDKFTENFFYLKGDATIYDSFLELGKLLADLDKKMGLCTNKLFYLATLPNLYKTILKNISSSGLVVPCAHFKNSNWPEIWTRVMIEKPFGINPQEAEDLDILLNSLFGDQQIFRIDHYLAKETIQNILSFRFANAVFEPIWNSKFIEKVEIELYETGGIDGRAEFYDSLGSLRDVGQNHLLQMIALVAMDDPGSIDPEALKKARSKVFENIKLSKSGNFVRAQFNGYRNLEGVNPKSETDTAFLAELEIDNSKWKKVPFIISTGKMFDKNVSRVKIYFKEKDSCALCRLNDSYQHQNAIIFDIQPEERISVTFWAKRPGFKYALETKNLSFSYSQFETRLPNAYERVLFDCIRGDQMFFASMKEVREEWRISDDIEKALRKNPLKFYQAGQNPSKIFNN